MAPRSRSTRTTPRSTASAKSSQRQSSLTFNNSRVTKPSTAATGKDKKSKDAEAKSAKLLVQAEEQSAAKQQPQDVDEISVNDDTPTDTQIEEKEEIEAQIPIRSQVKISPSEAAARNVSETQIRKYWKTKEAERKTPRLHQEGLSLFEKILREFDMSYQYGPCIGITRTKRWYRAQNLGLGPPIEVLAVLLKEDDAQKDMKFERAYMDTLANARLGVVAQ